MKVNDPIKFRIKINKQNTVIDGVITEKHNDIYFQVKCMINDQQKIKNITINRIIK